MSIIMKFKTNVFVFIIYCLVSFTKSQLAEQCLTPAFDVGRCVNIFDCQAIINIINNKTLGEQFNPELRKYFCGYDGPTAKVCCPDKVPLPQPSDNGNLLPTEDCGEAETFVGTSTNEKANLMEFPWQVALKYNINKAIPFSCGGTLINKRYVLTAAHCITLNLIGVRLGEYDFSTSIDCVDLNNIRTCAPAHQDFDVTRSDATIHPQYQRAALGYDIALIRLPRDVIFNEAVKPICLPINENLTPKSLTNLLVTGWGYTEYGDLSQVLLKSTVPYKDNDACMREVPVPIYDTQLCAGETDGQYTCNGDRGGPIVTTLNVDGRVKTVQVGLVSYGPARCYQFYPGIYTRLTSFTKWIMDNVKP